MTGIDGMAGGQTLLVSSVNGGGVFLASPDGVERLSVIDTAGMARTPSGWAWARQSEMSNELRLVADGSTARVEVAPYKLDLHDVLWHDDDLYVVATEINAVLRLDGATHVEKQRWKLPGEADACHVNSICIHEGRLLASRFGPFTRHRGYKGRTAGAGEVFDVASGATVVRGLSQPHSLLSYDGLLWLCDSEAYTLRWYRDFEEAGCHRFEGYLRGLAIDDGHIRVGLSRGRNDPRSAMASACVRVLDRATMETTRTHVLPVDEVYDIRIVDTPVAALRDAAWDEAFREIGSLRVSRDAAVRREHEQRASVAALGELAHALRVGGERAQVDLGAERHANASLTAEVSEEREWGARLGVEVERLGAVVATQQAALDERAQRIADLERQLGAAQALLASHVHFADLVVGSRSWRWTRLMRRAEPVRPAPAPPMEYANPGIDIQVPDARLEDMPRRADLPVAGLAFADEPAPRVSIVVAARGDYTRSVGCLRAIAAAADPTPFELILVDDGPGGTEVDRLSRVPGVRFVRHDPAPSARASANATLALVRAPYVLFLDCGSRVGAGWLAPLLQTFALFHRCGLAGSLLVQPDGHVLEAGGIVWCDGGVEAAGRGEDPALSAYRHVHEVDHVSAGSLMVPTHVLRELEGYDARYASGRYADADLAFRVRELGHRVYLQPGSVVVHDGAGRLDAAADGALDADREAFVRRWSQALARDQVAAGEMPFLARERAQRRRVVLVVDRHAPHPDRDAGSRAIWQLLRVLYLHGFHVKFWSQDPAEEPGYRESLRAHGIESLSAAEKEGGFEGWLARHGACIDYAVLSRPLVAIAALEPLRRHSSAAVVYYGHDIHHLRIEREFEVSGERWLRGHAAGVREVEETLWSGADLVLYPSDEETAFVRAWLEANGGSALSATAPLFAFEGDATPAAPDGRSEILFVGNFGHAPNGDGAAWFVEEVWPLVKARAPGLRLVLAGASPDERILALRADDVLVTGYLPEATLVEHYGRALVAIAPLRFGAGVKGKVIEAMRHGVPCVCTPVAAQGLATAHALRVADTAPGFAREIADLLEPASWLASSTEGQSYVAAHYSVDAVWSALSGVLDDTPFADVAERRASMATRRQGSRADDAATDAAVDAC